MSRELDPAAVAARLASLHASYVPEHLDDARARLARERPRADEPFARAVARRLDELRALCELSRRLQRR